MRNDALHRVHKRQTSGVAAVAATNINRWKNFMFHELRARRCTAAARALGAEARALRFLDDVVALLRGDVAAAVRARAWPFAIGRRQPDRNYVI
ncbi:hypothetical protein HW555_011879 [Spodoptera exigua]|uniref:Uncharacterized protein n=1 Tax=Spodoptera exigua TaxID=7107 RepID=A0A835G696_SPOEX|nr:hypothetical protein HW555_011879 [Spodoptera exigua]